MSKVVSSSAVSVVADPSRDPMGKCLDTPQTEIFGGVDGWLAGGLEFCVVMARMVAGRRRLPNRCVQVKAKEMPCSPGRMSG
jgi:hypothetical protein